MLDDGFTMPQIDTMQTELNAVRSTVSELYFKQVKLNARVKSLLKLREERLDAAIHVTHATSEHAAGPSPGPQPSEEVEPADAAVLQVEHVEEMEGLEQMAMTAHTHKAASAEPVCAADSQAEAEERKMPLLKVADKSKQQLMAALELAQQSILGVLSPRSRSLVLASPPPQSDEDDRDPAESPHAGDDVLTALDKAEMRVLESQDEQVESGETRHGPGVEDKRGESVEVGGAPKAILTSAAVDAAREAAGLAAMDDAKHKATVGDFGAAHAARQFAAAQFALARLDMAAELLVSCRRRRPVAWGAV